MTTFEFKTYAKQNDKILNYSQTTSLGVFGKSKRITMIDNIILNQFDKINANMLKEKKHQNQTNSRREKVLNR